jgi:lipopolysaccharide transport system permease protein
MSATTRKWDWKISPVTTDWSWNIKDLVSYRHLMISLIKREFLLGYQQTILGPLWVVVQPVLTLIIYVLVFKKLIGVSIGMLPPVLFYFSGIVLWNFFLESFERTSNTFREHIHLFSKVYFPRIIMPLSLFATNSIRCLIQLVLLLLIIAYYACFKNFTVNFGLVKLAFPFAILLTGFASLALGLIVSIITAKYRDLGNLISICIRLLMFVTPVLYPLASVRPELWWIVQLNPLTSFFELFRLALLGEGTVAIGHLSYSVLFVLVSLAFALFIFNKKGKQLIDVI